MSCRVDYKCEKNKLMQRHIAVTFALLTLFSNLLVAALNKIVLETHAKIYVESKKQHF